MGMTLEDHASEARSVSPEGGTEDAAALEPAIMTANGCTGSDRIPPEIKHRIGTFLDAEATRDLAQVNRDWRCAIENFNWQHISVARNPLGLSDSKVMERWTRLRGVVRQRAELARRVTTLTFVSTNVPVEAMSEVVDALSPQLRRIALEDTCEDNTTVRGCLRSFAGTAVLDSIRIFPKLVHLTCRLHGDWSFGLFRALRSMPHLEDLSVTADGDDYTTKSALLPVPALPRLRNLCLDAPRSPRAAAMLLTKAEAVQRLSLLYGGPHADGEVLENMNRFLGYVRFLLSSRTITRLELGTACAPIVTTHAVGDWLPALSILAIQGKVSWSNSDVAQERRS